MKYLAGHLRKSALAEMEELLFSRFRHAATSSPVQKTTRVVIIQLHLCLRLFYLLGRVLLGPLDRQGGHIVASDLSIVGAVCPATQVP